MIKLFRSVWEQFSIYLPILLMGILALGTYWLVRSTPTYAPQPGALQTRHKLDYRMKNLSLKSFDGQGRLKNELLGEEARHFPDTDTLEIDQIRVKNFSSSGRISTASANSSVINSDATEAQLLGDAQVIRESATEASGKFSPAISVQSEFLHVYLETEIVKSHKPVVLSRGNSKFTADAMEINNVDRLLSLKGRVRGTLIQEKSK